MSMKWTVGAIVALLAAMFALPGIASAHDASLSGEAPVCADGAFDVTWTLTLGSAAGQYPAYTTPSDSTVEGVGADTGLPLDTGGDERIFTDPLDAGDGEYIDHSTFDTPPAGNQVTASGEVYWQDLEAITVSYTVDTPTLPCHSQLCIDGDVVTVGFESQETATNDCDPVRLCVDGESVTVTEFDAESLDGENGSCTPSEPPPPPTVVVEPTPEPTPEPTVVAEVSPAVEEVVALPSAGYGTTSGGSYAWTILLAVTLVGFGGVTALVARPRK